MSFPNHQLWKVTGSEFIGNDKELYLIHVRKYFVNEVGAEQPTKIGFTFTPKEFQVVTTHLVQFIQQQKKRSFATPSTIPAKSAFKPALETANEKQVVEPAKSSPVLITTTISDKIQVDNDGDKEHTPLEQDRKAFEAFVAKRRKLAAQAAAAVTPLANEALLQPPNSPKRPTVEQGSKKWRAATPFAHKRVRTVAPKPLVERNGMGMSVDLDSSELDDLLSEEAMLELMDD